MDNNNNQNKDNNNSPKNRQTLLIVLLITIAMFLILTYMRGIFSSATNQKITYDEFIKKVEAGEVASVLINQGEIEITPAGQENAYIPIKYYTVAVDDPGLTDRLLKAGVPFEQKETDSSSVIVSILMTYVLPLLIFWVLIGFVMRRMSRGGGGIMGVGKSNAKIYVQKETGVTFKDVAGQDEAKESLQEVVDFLHNPGKYAKIGAKLPKGALLVGPPGTGKTLLARAVAGEAHVPFFSLAGSDFVEMYVGVGASRVRDLFKEAQKNAPCIIFIDEVDAIGKSRDSRFGGNDEREQTLNQLLSEMDGFDASKGVLILAATNRPEILDKALLRPGRFDRRVIVDKPDLKGRKETLKVHSKDVNLDDTVDFEEIALAKAGAVGSDLANMVNEAAIMAVKNGRAAVNQKDLLEAIEVVMMGKEKKDRIMTPKERKIVSYHEIGHALAAALQKNTDPIQKITIVPRTMGALGYAWYVPEEEKHLQSKDELREQIVTALAGRAAEEIIFQSVTTGASNDIEKATAIARAMVTEYGMSDKFGLIKLESVQDRYLGGNKVMECGDNTAAEVDVEVMKIISEAYEQAKKFLNENRECLDELADYLLTKESITGKQFMEIFKKYRPEEAAWKEKQIEQIADTSLTSRSETMEKNASADLTEDN